jgi:outer membrane protein OmpA-like peptidoglycan-associated protein
MKLSAIKTFFLVGFLFPVLLYGQSLRATERLAKDLFRYGDYIDALPLYKQLHQSDPENPEFMTRYAVCCLNSDYSNEALSFLLKAKEKNYKGDDIDLHLAEAYHLNHEFDKAISYFETFKKGLDPIKYGDEIKAINHQIQMCNYGKELVKVPVEVTIENLGSRINSPFPDFVPVVSGDEKTLIFTSRRPNTTGGEIEEETNHYYEDIYISTKDENGEWSEAKHLEHNTAGHDASVSLSPQGDHLYIYRHENNGDLFVSKLNGSSWSAPEKLPVGINTRDREPSLSVSPDGKLLFFSSDRPGGLGGLDIYYCIREGDYGWSAPKNCGPGVNTIYDDDAPFVHADGKTLYFSSQGHNSMGGYDIFTTHFDVGAEKHFSAPVNVGYPINTADHDIFFVWSPDGKRAYFSSIRKDGYGEKDIYMLTRADAKVSLIVLKGSVLAKDESKPVGARVKVYDNTTKELVQDIEANSESGKFLIALPPGRNYQVSIDKNGYLPYSVNVDIPEKEEFFEHKENFFLETLTPGSMANLRNVFFDHDKATLRPESTVELDRVVKFLQENKGLYFEVAGHTDSVGTADYNYKLSDERAHAVKNYLIARGVDKHRLVSVGYGEDFSIAGNSSAGGRQLNRRTELIIIEKPAHTNYGRKNGYYYINKK